MNKPEHVVKYCENGQIESEEWYINGQSLTDEQKEEIK